MDAIAVIAPILPGKASEFRVFSRELAGGAWHAEYVNFITQAGLSRVRAWLSESDHGAVGIILYEGDSPEGFLQHIATSKDPFSNWFREKVQEIHGVDLTAPVGPPLELVSDVCGD